MRMFTLPFVLLTLAACGNLADPGTGPTGDPDVPAPAVGAVTGRVLSKELGVMSGIRVVANQDDKTATTDERGVWTMSGLKPGLVALQLANLPAQCKAPEARPVDLNPGGTARVRFLVDCSGSGQERTAN
jgi:hypothetical protein